MEKEYELPVTDLVNGLADFQQSSQFCDAVIRVEGKEFKVHRVVMAAVSPYFRGMYAGEFIESKEQTVELKVCMSIVH